ncbi:MAG: polyribonucleotide nucleotidyltransferase [Paludibacteraceae bacterium]|nr:polyribonucleotide nucleotidyltransferase [Paludibacteraceae bacterium]MBR1716753.1 polyribonucleotide nucleotidyltransferase [Paludibacteraceae bacterium]
MNIVTKEIALPDGRVIKLETGKLAKQADGAVMATLGNTMILATVCSAKDAVPGTDFMPLTVEYKEKFASAGRFPGGFTRREGKASDYEILIARLIDRALRPLFPSNYHADTFVNVTMYSADGIDMPESIAGLAAGAALACSDIPFEGPVSEVRVARVDGKMVINPTFEQCEHADLELMVAATYDNIMMVEGEMKEVPESVMLEAIKAAHEAIKPQCLAIDEMMKAYGKETKREYCHEVNDEELKQAVHDFSYARAYAQATAADTDKHHREEMFTQIREDFKAEKADYMAARAEALGIDIDEVAALVDRYYHDVEKEAMRRAVLDEGKRLDGRKTTEIRPIWCEVGYLPGPHGSSIFTRGETQSLSTVTLGTSRDEKIVDEALIQGTDKFLLHYNFPPFSTGEAKAQRGVGRREIGHGNLACRALKNMIPEDFPYTVRVVSDILESNGSSSMATVCAGTLALMDAGVPMKKPVSGIAMGLISENQGKNYAILSDILGDEDHLGDMDFKTTGTKDGLTACQMDIKVDGLSYEILENALAQAHEARMYILGKILECMPAPRADLKPHAPRITSFYIPKDMIGAVIGPGGKIIQGIQAETGAVISIDEDEKGGKVEVASNNGEQMAAAIAKIKAIVALPEVGEEYDSVVKSLMPYGCFVEFMPGKEGLLHISEIDWKRYETMDETGIKEGDHIRIKLLEIDPKTGKFRLSAKVLKEKPEGYVEPSRPERGDRGPRPERRGPRPERGSRNENPDGARLNRSPRH